MLMHHSRNTEQKRWEESLMLALGGATKVLRAHLPAVVAMDGFEAAWEGLIKVRAGSRAAAAVFGNNGRLSVC
jgi:hypothetical protein